MRIENAAGVNHLIPGYYEELCQLKLNKYLCTSQSSPTVLTLPNILLPCSSHGKESACSAGDLGSIPGWGRSSGEGNGNPL